MAKINIIKITADGEQTSIEGEFEPHFNIKTQEYEPMLPQVAPYLQMLDDRLFEMNERILASNELVRQLTPDAQRAVHHVMEVLMGQAPKSDIAKIVKEGQERREKELAEIALTEKNKKKPLPN